MKAPVREGRGSPRVPRRLARRIDRLARRAHAFHRFAHHPACDEYAGEVLRAGRTTRICRGCALAACGCFAGLVLAILFPPTLAVAAAATAVGFGLALASHRRRSIGKTIGRFLPAGLFAFALAAGLRTGGSAGAALALGAILAAAVLVRAYRRRGPDRGPCRACPELESTVPCRGYAPIVRREIAFRRLASAWIDSGNAGRIPG